MGTYKVPDDYNYFTGGTVEPGAPGSPSWMNRALGFDKPRTKKRPSKVKAKRRAR